MSPIQLYEYDSWHETSDVASLKQILENTRDSQWIFDEDRQEESDETRSGSQFLEFDGSSIRAKNYVGFIQNGSELIEIYPKVFKNHTSRNTTLMLQHMLFWLARCKKFKFPFLKANLGEQSFESLPQMVLYLMADQIYHAVTSAPLLQYQEVEESMSVPKGRINFGRYAINSLSRGNFQLLECDHEPFLFDNRVNRIIKYAARLMVNQARYPETTRVLQEILFVLDEVEDAPCTAYDINAIALNSYYRAYHEVLQTCRLIIEQQTYANHTYVLSQWCLLLPMEYIYEGFITTMIESALAPVWNVWPQKSDLYLAKDTGGNNVFNLQHDILLTSSNRAIILDMKYKLRANGFQSDPKKGISQADMYQMVSYAYRRGISEVFLISPNFDETLSRPYTFEIQTELNLASKIRITCIEMPFWSFTHFDQLEVMIKNALREVFL